MDYKFREIEKRWQKYWSENESFRVVLDEAKPKYYVLDMFPYPSGAGLHVGHPLGYIASDIVSRFKRQKGFNVLHPMGYDSFGLPAEQYAIQTGQHPAKTTEVNINRYREQLDKIGFSFDWSKELRTSNSDYYKWTQWIFIQLFNSWYNLKTNKAENIQDLISHFEKHGTNELEADVSGELNFNAEEWRDFSSSKKQELLLNYRLSYRSKSTVNWCPELGTVLANDEVKDGKSERGGYPVVQKEMMQWSMRISSYAQRLLDGLESIDWPEPLKESQRNWIGRSEGASLEFQVKNSEEKIEVFTTRPDTIFGVSFMVLAPENPLVDLVVQDTFKESIEQYRIEAAKKSERDRMADVKTVSGQFTGAYAIHPFTKKEIPIWIGDYVLATYGTGAVMAVPAHDSRDWSFANHFDIEKPQVVAGGNISKEAHEAKEGIIINSDFLNGLEVKEAISKAISQIEAMGIGKGKVNFRLRDAIFGRQRYWGEPIPIYYKEGIAHTVKVEHLPLELPEVDAYKPTPDGEPPLARSKSWKYNPETGEIGSVGYDLELTTMPGWAGSSWYFLRYTDPKNNEQIADPKNLEYWGNVDLYIGGSEHATGHLLYSRFWNKFLKDIGYINKEEPFQKLINQGMILGTSAIAYRINGQNKFVSKELKNNYQTTAIHVDVSMVNASDELDIEAFKNWRQDLNDAEFIMEDSKFICAREVEKMSKRWYNVVNPDDICDEYGADSLRMYEMFLGPLEQSKPWNTAGLSGVHGFLKKYWRLFVKNNALEISEEKASKEELKSLHTLLKKVNEDIANFSFNTSISAFMICVNELQSLSCNKREILEPLTIALSPFAPHITEETWSILGHEGGVSLANFPEAIEEYLIENSFSYPIAFNGKMKLKVDLPLSLSKDEIEAEIMSLEKVIEQLAGKEPKRVIVVPSKIVNIVI